MRFLADENVPRASVTALRAAGHDVLAAAEAAPGATDTALLQMAERDGRILVTFDKDFGAEALERGLGASTGILLLRFVPESPAETAALVLDLVARGTIDLEGSITAFDRERIRQRRLPPPA